MFRNYFALLKILFVQQFRVKDSTKHNSTGKKKRRKLSSTGVMYIVLAVVFLPILIGVAGGVYVLGRVQGSQNADVTLTLLLLICQALVTFFGVPSVITNVFASKDGDRLLCLPMRASTIFAAKLSVVYINETITSAITILFVLLPFGIGSGLGAAFYLLLPLAIILLPVLPLTLASIIAIPFAFLLRKFSNSGVLKVILQLVLFLSFMVVYMLVISQLTGVSSDNMQGTDEMAMLAEFIRQIVEQSQHIVKWILPDSMLAKAMTATSFGTSALNTLGALGLNVVLFGIVLLISVPMYKSSLIGNLENSGRRKRFDVAELRQTGKSKSLLSQLMICDFKRTMRDGQLGFQMLVNVVLMPLIIVIMAVVFNQTSDGALNDYVNTQTYQAIVALIMVGYLGSLAGSTNGWGLYAISRERQSFYLLKTLPISVKQLLLSKILLSTIVLTVTSVVAIVIAIFMFNLYWYWAIACVVTMILLQFATTCITTYLDIRKPVLNWTNFKQGLSNSVKSWVAILIAYAEILVVGLFGGGFVVLYTFVPNIWVIIGMWLLLIIVSSLLAFFAFRFVVSKGEKLLDKVEA